MLPARKKIHDTCEYTHQCKFIAIDVRDTEPKIASFLKIKKTTVCYYDPHFGPENFFKVRLNPNPAGKIPARLTFLLQLDLS